MFPGPTSSNASPVARAADGYRVLFSWNELYNLDAGQRALVVYDKEGRPVDDRPHGASLLAAGDRRVGPRYLRGLVELSVLRLPG